jgi:hypothetical protein
MKARTEMNSVATNVNGTALTTTGSDPYSAYGAKVGVQGLFLSFKNGEFLYGQSGDVLPLGTRLAANMGGLRVGWRRWYGEQVTDDRTELLVDSVPMEPRSALGDMDPALWETGTDGRKRDPWQLTNILELVDAAGQQYIYATGAKGGIGAIGRLCAAYGKEFRQRPGMVPIIELGADFYMHKEFGKTYFPTFTLVDWSDETVLEIDEPEAQSVTDSKDPMRPLAKVGAVPSTAPLASAPPVQKAAPAPSKPRARF